MARKTRSSEAAPQGQPAVSAVDEQALGHALDAEQIVLPASDEVQSEARGLDKPKLLTDEAYKARLADRKIPWADVYAAFPGRPQNGGPVTLEQYRPFREAWIEKHGEPDFLLTREALSSFRRLFHRNPSADDEGRIKALTGKAYGITPQELQAFFDEKREEIGLELDGEPVVCAEHFGKFQPRTRFITDRETGAVKTRKDGKPVQIGSFVSLDAKPKNLDTLREKSALIYEKEAGGEWMAVVAICERCRWQRFADTDTWSRAEAIGYVDRKMARVAKLDENASDLRSSLAGRKPNWSGDRRNVVGRRPRH